MNLTTTIPSFILFLNLVTGITPNPEADRLDEPPQNAHSFEDGFGRDDPARQDPTYWEALETFHTGDAGAASKAFASIASRYPNSAAAAFHYAYSLYKAGRLQEARKATEKTLAIAPELVDALYLAGLIAFRESRFDTAQRYFEAVVIRAPKSDLGRSARDYLNDIDSEASSIPLPPKKMPPATSAAARAAEYAAVQTEADSRSGSSTKSPRNLWWAAVSRLDYDTNPAYIAESSYNLSEEAVPAGTISISSGLDLLAWDSFALWSRGEVFLRAYSSETSSAYDFASAFAETGVWKRLGRLDLSSMLQGSVSLYGWEPFLDVESLIVQARYHEADWTASKLRAEGFIRHAWNAPYAYLAADGASASITQSFGRRGAPVTGGFGFNFHRESSEDSFYSGSFPATTTTGETVSLGWTESWNASFFGYGPNTWIYFALPWNFRLEAWANLWWREYDQPERQSWEELDGTWSEWSAQRHDTRYYAGFRLSKPVMDALTLSISYEAVINFSSIGEVSDDPVDRNYSRHLVSVGLSFHHEDSY